MKFNRLQEKCLFADQLSLLRPQKELELLQNICSLNIIKQLKITSLFNIKIYCNDMHKSFLIPPSINRILGKNRNSVNLIQQSANITLRKQNCSPISKDGASEYTFEPKINSSNIKRRTLQKFIEDQQRFQQEKERKINQLKVQISKWEDEQMRPSPHINTFSKQKTNSFMNNQSVFDRLSKDRPSKHSITQADSFSPNILPRSKQIYREKTVSDLLYQDAKRRQSKQKIVKLSEQKKLLAMSAPKINKNTNQLVRKKIFSQFIYLTNDSSMNPLLALSVLQEIFNVKLRDTSNQSVRRIIQLIANQKMEVSTEKLWGFIDLIIGSGLDNCFSKELQYQIKQKYHFFYQQRIKKQKKKTQQEQQPAFKPKTLEASEEMAEKHRTKQCKKISEFIQKEKIHVHIENQTISLQDLFIISQMKKDKENQQKRKQKETAQLAQCTFKPHIIPIKSTAKNKKKIVLRQPLKQKASNQNIKNNQQIGLQMKKSYSKVNSIEKTDRSVINSGKKQNILSRNRKSVDSLSVRLFLGRAERQFQQNMTMRGYPQGQNWTENNRLKHRQIVQNSEKIKGRKNRS